MFPLKKSAVPLRPQGEQDVLWQLTFIRQKAASFQADARSTKVQVPIETWIRIHFGRLQS
jgi:hypothetical protein